MFNAVPDGDEITIHISACTVPEINLHPADEASIQGKVKPLI
jgi:hypothetical protein